MKRPKSYGEDLDVAAEKAAGGAKDWGRRAADLDRSSSSSSLLHRRFYPKGAVDNGRRVGLSSSPSSATASCDRSLDDERDGTSRSSRKPRFDHDPDGFDRSSRKAFDRYRDSGSGAGDSRTASPRGGYGGDRVHRSDSFSSSSSFRLDIPKGFRSDRDRIRRDDGRRRSGGVGNRDSDGDSKFGSDRAGHRAASEKRAAASAKSPPTPAAPPPAKEAPHRWKELGSGRSRNAEAKKAEEETHDKSVNSSEMEEGELEPEPQSEPQLPPEEPVPELEAPAAGGQCDKQLEVESNVWPNSSSEMGAKMEEAADVEMKTKEAEDDDKVSGRENDGTEVASSEEMSKVITEVASAEEMSKVIVNSEENISELVENDEMIVVACVNGENLDDGKEEQMPLHTTLEEKIVEGTDVETISSPGGRAMDEVPSSEVKHLERRGFDLEMEAGDFENHDSHRDLHEKNCGPVVALKLMAEKLNQINGEDKGKNLAISITNVGDSGNYGGNLNKERDDAMEGRSNRGLDLFLHSDLVKEKNVGSTYHSKSRSDKLKMEPLDLSLGLPNFLSAALPSSDNNLRQAPNSPSRGRSLHSLPTTTYTQSDGFTASVSISGSQTFVHNPSCSLTHNSYDYENSVGSHPIFQGVEHASTGIWQGQSSNDPKRKDIPLCQKIMQNGNGVAHSAQAPNGLLHGHSGSTGIPVADRQASLHRQFSNHLRRDETRSPTQSIGSFDAARSEHSRDKRWVTKERNGGGVLFRTSQGDTDKSSITSPGVAERIVAKIVREPTSLMARRIQEIPDHSLCYLKEIAGEMLNNEAKIRSLQELLDGRSDLKLETLSNCHRVQLEILVAVKTGLADFLCKAANVASADLVEIFLNLKCKNLTCQSILPVDECDCKVCGEKNGFCSACMCIICSKFDMADNTCSWVGCDVCVHWCHTDCALRGSHIRNGRNATGSHGTTEMQFFCVCGHPSEMFGFVMEVFRTCAKEWKAETFSKELEYVRRIFRASEDARGRQLYDVATRMLEKLGNKSNLLEVYNCVMAFLTENESKMNKTPTFQPAETAPQKNLGERAHCAIGSSQDSLWLRPASAEKAPLHNEKANGASPILDWETLSRRAEAPKLQTISEKKLLFDELDSIVRMKQAEAKMFMTRADDARREAESLKRIATAKNEKIKEEYESQIRKLNLVEAEERRRQKLEEVQVLERAQLEYFNMKARMEADMKDLLLKMEATKRNLGS